jgi:trans-2,3-dihydro-3-hydroxyanthranilate isomerase
MTIYPFMQVDAFADRPLSGNPCAILFDTDELDVDTMLAIAREMNLSETAFVRQSTVADFGVSYFTPAEEIPMAGHPTIATTFALIDSGRLRLTADHTTISLELPIGPIRVDIHAHSDLVERIVMTQKKPEFLSIHDPSLVLPLFGLTADDAVRGLDELRRVQMDISAYAAYRQQSDFFSPHLFCLGGVTPAGDTFARHFGVPPDTMEDPFTGSATGGMAAYLWRYGLIDKATFVAEQGHWMDRPGQAMVEVVGPRDDIEAVKVGGAAVTVIRGEIHI